MSNYVTSLIRTYVPYIVGFVVSFLTTRGIDVTPDNQATISAFLTFAFGSAYYAIARWIEKKNPSLGGKLLGREATVKYTAVK